jgi:predicted ArsR family transcriptional regulator
MGAILSTAFQRSAFQNNAFQIAVSVGPDIGSSITGGTFSRRRWRKLREEKRARVEAIARAREAQDRQELEAAQAAEKAKVDAFRADQARRHQAIIDALAARSGAVAPGANLGPVEEALRKMGYAPRASSVDDEDEAVALLLLGHNK